MWRNMKVVMPRIWFQTEEELSRAASWLSEALFCNFTLHSIPVDGLFWLEFTSLHERDRAWAACSHWRSIREQEPQNCNECGQARDDCDCPSGFDKGGYAAEEEE